MHSLANRLAIQHFVNAYTQETGKGHLLHKSQQSLQLQTFSQGLTLLSIPITSIQARCFFPLSYAAVVAELCYESQRLIPMPEKTAMLYYCFRETFYHKFGEYYQTSQQQLADQPAKFLSVT